METGTPASSQIERGGRDFGDYPPFNPMHAAPTAVPGSSTHTPIVGVLDELTKHRRFNSQIARLLVTDHETRGLGQAIANCAARLQVELMLDGDELGAASLRGGALCNRRLCPFCEWRRTRAWRARLLSGLDEFASAHPKHSALFLTLTVRNCRIDELRDTVQEMNKSWNRLCKTRAFPSVHWFRRLEVTLQHGGGATPMAHPHFHCLLLVPPSYWGKGYWKQLRWQQEWQMASRLDYAPVVDVRRAKAKGQGPEAQEGTPRSAVIEAAKYASKATDLVALGDALPAFHWEMRGLRSFALSKPLQDFVKAADPAGDELLDAAASGPSDGALTLSGIAQWFEEHSEYRFVL